MLRWKVPQSQSSADDHHDYSRDEYDHHDDARQLHLWLLRAVQFSRRQ
jgi:hypothetical protein